MHVLVVDIGGTHLKVRATSRKQRMKMHGRIASELTNLGPGWVGFQRRSTLDA